MEQFLNILRSLEKTKLMALVGVFVAVASFFVYVLNFSSTPELGLLYSHLEQEEAARVVDKLKTSGIPYEIQGNGAQILAQADKIPELRMEMALNNIVSGGSLGYEIFDRSDVLGTSSAMLNINHLRALEGELSKSIKTISDVQSARVHLVIPKRELFSKENSQPSASIVLRMKAGQRLSSNQIQAVQALVTSAVTNMTNDRISIIDDKGTLLAKGRDAGGLADTFSNQSAIKEEFEEKLSRQVEMLLERTVGADRVRVEITVDMDFDRVTTQSVDFDPDGQVARSINSIEEGINANEVNGVADSVSIQNAIPNKENQNAGGKSSSESKNASNKVEEVTAFEISNKTTTTVRETGNIKRMSVAVLVDGNYQKDAVGNPSYTARSPEELLQLTELVQTAIGFKADRGDIVKVINMKFQVPDDIQQMDKTPFWQGWLDSLNFKRLVELIIIGIFSLIIISNFLKPFVNRLISLKSNEIGNRVIASDITHLDVNGVNRGTNANASRSILESDNYPNDGLKQIVLDESEDFDINLVQVEGAIKSSTINQISKLIEQNPNETLSLLRSWLYEGK